VVKIGFPFDYAQGAPWAKLRVSSESSQMGRLKSGSQMAQIKTDEVEGVLEMAHR